MGGVRVGVVSHLFADRGRGRTAQRSPAARSRARHRLGSWQSARPTLSAFTRCSAGVNAGVKGSAHLCAPRVARPACSSATHSSAAWGGGWMGGCRFEGGQADVCGRACAGLRAASGGGGGQSASGARGATHLEALERKAGLLPHVAQRRQPPPSAAPTPTWRRSRAKLVSSHTSRSAGVEPLTTALPPTRISHLRSGVTWGAGEGCVVGGASEFSNSACVCRGAVQGCACKTRRTANRAKVSQDAPCR